MKNIFRGFVLTLALGAGLAESAWAQARLRLTESTLGPISIAAGANGPAQVIEAYNIGTGALGLSFRSNATWLAGSVGAARPCVAPNIPAPSCLPVSVALNTATLAAGTYTGALTVLDANAIDAPQTISVTVQVGGGVPNNIILYAPPTNGSDSVRFFTNSVLTTNASTQSGGAWLDVAYEGQGSFNFVQPYRVVARHLPGMPQGNFQGRLQLGGSAFAGDNKQVNVSFVVTTQPIAFAAPDVVRVKVPQNGQPVTANIGVGNRGQGSLAVSGVTTTLSSGTGWLAGAPANGFLGASLTLTPGSLAPGTYRGSAAIAVNAINGPALNVPVEMEVVANPTPQIAYQGVLNNADFVRGDNMGVGTIAALFGDFLADAVAVNTSATELPRTLGGMRVLVNGQAAPLYFVSPRQINFQIPFETTGGPATIQVERNGVVGNRVAVNIVPAAGRILLWSGTPYGIIVNADGTLPLPPSLRIGTFTSRPARPGDTLVIYAIGFGRTNPPVASGGAAPASPLAQISGVTVHFGPRSLFGTSVPATALFAGLSPGFVGLYQINVTVPQGVTLLNDLDLSIEYNGEFTNNIKIATGQ
ncbi:MAG: hypothetical protein NW208_17715 [Bryobacter sp.]|nr:hypothetical protein [Bryobacter sp.]